MPSRVVEVRRRIPDGDLQQPDGMTEFAIIGLLHVEDAAVGRALTALLDEGIEGLKDRRRVCGLDELRPNVSCESARALR